MEQEAQKKLEEQEEQEEKDKKGGTGGTEQIEGGALEEQDSGGTKRIDIDNR